MDGISNFTLERDRTVLTQVITQTSPSQIPGPYLTTSIPVTEGKQEQKAALAEKHDQGGLYTARK